MIRAKIEGTPFDGLSQVALPSFRKPAIQLSAMYGRKVRKEDSL